MATCILINILAMPEVNKGCEFDSTKFNALFFYGVLIAETVTRILFHWLWISNDPESNQKRRFFV